MYRYIVCSFLENLPIVKIRILKVALAFAGRMAFCYSIGTAAKETTSYVIFFICEFWSMDLLRKQTLFSICRCRCTQIWKMVPCCKIYFHKWTSENVLKTVKSQKIFEMLPRQWTWWARGCLPPSGFDHSSNIWHILPPLLRGIIMSESVFLISVRRRSL